MRVANQVDEELLAALVEGPRPGDARARARVCVSARASPRTWSVAEPRIAQRAHGDLLVVHVRTEDRSRSPNGSLQIREPDTQSRRRVRGGQRGLGVDGVSASPYEQHVTQIVVGEPLRPRWQELLRGSFVNRLIRKAPEIDVHVIARASSR